MCVCVVQIQREFPILAHGTRHTCCSFYIYLAPWCVFLFSFAVQGGLSGERVVADGTTNLVNRFTRCLVGVACCVFYFFCSSPYAAVINISAHNALMLRIHICASLWVLLTYILYFYSNRLLFMVSFFLLLVLSSFFLLLLFC
ncbi:hypothetical protein, unlikely [Trypanosoma congolense IL3000]|uniref:Uncharacterized protein n=1 Tax=Trypanosoma congolense (strain IL3000) TaxID=1068625 RepID=F9W6G2_TRYCI|nr:hypothetical protein, unlikely [Trypanosoma congolense IL3000]